MLHLTPVRISVAIVLLIALDAPSVDAQTTLRGHLGVSGFTVVGGDAPGGRSAFAFPTAGLMVQRRLPVARQVAVEVGLFYVGKGATSDVQVRIDGGPPVPATTELRLAYLDIPILLRADFEPRTGVTLALLGGIAIEFLLDEGIEIITEDDSRTGVQTTENFNGNSFAGQLGAA
ncbi:MAG: outer membrane beta-barrel protein, partial [Bacteroidota bacterium]